MNDKTMRGCCYSTRALCGTLLGLSTTLAAAQSAVGPITLPASEPSPYSIGVSQGFTHDSNVFRTQNGKSDTYSTTSLLGGFDQLIGRQHVFGRGSVSAHRYFDQHRLDNTAYSLAGGVDWQTVGNLSGNLTASLARYLTYPVASGIVPVEVKNESQTKAVDARARWGAGQLSAEGALGYSSVDHSNPDYVSSVSSTKTASLGVNYRPGGPLRLGVAVRGTRTDTPRMIEFPEFSGNFESNQARGKHLDFNFGYDLVGSVTTNGRISYTRVTNSNARLSGADFSGLTGYLNLNYQATGRTSFALSATRSTNATASTFNGVTTELVGQTLILHRESGLLQNNQVTNTIELAAIYQLTGKTTLNPGIRYTRAKLLSTRITGGNAQLVPDTTDVAKAIFVGATWAAAYNWGVGCSLSHESRDVSGGINYSYSANSIGCVAQYTWR